ncbi:hypothetical protein GP486_001527 [Trichoglossum hirsutum]|uniref:Protein kinase domain-containing protein n=1 Tax=Trichoglossum hirsutum TaxID=265104 RepID=A0A9P8LGI8_9PEZI|nr:hypothetical protein GP486_001527 [Trichoglossum hirsutum]
MPVVELTLAVLALVPPLLGAGRLAKETIKDVVHFPHDAAVLEVRFEICSRKLDATQRLLLSTDRIVKGRLYDSLAKESQKSIYLILTELYVLFISFTQAEANYRLEKEKLPQIPDVSPIDGSSLVKVVLGIETPSDPIYSSKVRWHRRAWWGISGKKKVYRFIEEYEDWLERLRDEILQFWWPLPPFNDAKVLAKLSQDEDAEVSGLSDKASLTSLLLASNDSAVAKDIWLSRDKLRQFRDFKDIGGSRAWGNWTDGRHVLVEYKSDGQDEEGKIEQKTLDRLEQLGLLLKRQSDPRFRVLKFLFLGHQFKEQRIGFVYEFPEGVEAPPNSLISSIPDVSDTNRPPLGVRMNLAFQICQSILLLHTVGWLHKNLRSENIIFFPRAEAAEGDPDLDGPKDLTPPAMRKFDNPWIIGFEFARMENDFSSRRKEDSISRNIYRHPQRWGLPSERHAKIHDIYDLLSALGVMLLEIGLWQKCWQLDETGNGFQDATDPRVVQRVFIEHAKARLGYTAGERYQKLTWLCLQGDAAKAFGIENDDKVDTKLKQALREQVVEVLDDLRRAL